MESLRAYLNNRGHGIPNKYYFTYVLDEWERPVPTEDESAVYLLMRDIKRRKIGESRVVFRGVRVDVSTVFTVFNQALLDGPPLLYESMTFTSNKASLDGLQERYYTRDAAVEGHKAMVQQVLMELKRHPRSVRRMKVAAKRGCVRWQSQR